MNRSSGSDRDERPVPTRVLPSPRMGGLVASTPTAAATMKAYGQHAERHVEDK